MATCTTPSIREKYSEMAAASKALRLATQEGAELLVSTELLNRFVTAIQKLEIKVLPEACTLGQCEDGILASITIPGEGLRFEMVALTGVHAYLATYGPLTAWLKCPYCAIAEEWNHGGPVAGPEDLGVLYDYLDAHEESCLEAQMGGVDQSERFLAQFAYAGGR